MRTGRIRTALLALLALPMLTLGALAAAPAAHAGAMPGSVQFGSNDFLNWNSPINDSQATLTANIGSTFTVIFPTDYVALCGISGGSQVQSVCFSDMIVTTTGGAVTPSLGLISTSVVTTFTVWGSGTLTLRPNVGVTCGSCGPLSIVITAVGPRSLVSTNCQTWNSNGSADESVSGHIGESFTVTFPELLVGAGSVGVNSAPCSGWSFTSTPGAMSPSSGSISTREPTTFTITGPGTLTLTMLGVNLIQTPLALTISVSVTAGDVPPDVMQQVGAPSTGTCATFVDSKLNWAGAPDGGWGMSWAQWMNGGHGGPVCTRSLYWTPSGRWSVR
jgi:hypothetical protein